MTTAKEIIQKLDLEPHPQEGGYYRRTYEAKHSQKVDNDLRKTASSIYYLLTEESRVGYWHRNRSEILHFFHCGSPLTYWLLSEDGQVEKYVLGNDIEQGHIPQLTVPGGVWKASVLNKGGEYGLISEVVIPEFHYNDMSLAQAEDIQSKVSQAQWQELQMFVKP